MYKIVLLRHGESEWNKKEIFTGWTDVDLTDLGILQAKEAGKILKKKKYSFDLCYSSFLKRANKTLNLVLEEMDLLWIPLKKDWRLNERHYGDLQGLNKKDLAKKFGEDQVFQWRRSYKLRPPEIKKTNKFNQINDIRYKGIKKIILSESLYDVVGRTSLFWKENIVKDLKDGKNILIVASGNSLRAIIKELSGISDSNISELNIPVASPMLFELDKNFKTKKFKFIGDPKKIKKLIEEAKNQGKLK